MNANELKYKSVFFQPHGIDPTFCEVGVIYHDEPEYVYHVSEPYKILVREVKIIPSEKVQRDNKPPYSYRIIKENTK
jgi:hypothetical protein